MNRERERKGKYHSDDKVKRKTNAKSVEEDVKTDTKQNPTKDTKNMKI